MSRLDRILLGVFVLLAVAAAGLGRDVALRLERGGAGRLELGREKPTRLEPATLAAFGRLGRPLRLTYYVSPAARMPAEMRRMALEVGDLLEALRARFPDRVETLVLDPEADLEGFAARQRVAPFRVRSVTRDAWDERTVWSTLVLSIEGGPEARIAGLRPEHLGGLQGLIVEWLHELAEPGSPRIALAAPAGFDELEQELSTRGELLRVDLDHGQTLPGAELLFWMRPARADAQVLGQLERFLAGGGSVVLADAPWSVREEPGTPDWQVSLAPRPTSLGALAAHFGLEWQTQGELLCDATSQTLETADGALPFPHRIRCIAPNQDFRTFDQQPNGTLVFVAPGALLPNAARLRELGRRARLLASSSDRSWLQALPEVPVAPGELTPAAGQPVPKQALLVDVESDDPWQGELFVAGSDSLFADGLLRMPNAAHRRLLDTLVARTASAERRVIVRRPGLAPAALPELTSLARLGWRAFVLGLPLVPVLWLALRGRVFARDSETDRRLGESFRRRRAPGIPPTHRPAWTRRGARLALGVLGVGAVAGLRSLGGYWDWTDDGVAGIDPLTRALVHELGSRGPTRATLVLSPPASLPPSLRGPTRALLEQLDELASAGLDLDLRRVVPEDLDPRARRALEDEGFRVFEASTLDEEVTRVARFQASLRLAHGARSVTLEFPDPAAFERLEFRMAQALARLEGGGPGNRRRGPGVDPRIAQEGAAAAGDEETAPATRPVHVAFASDVPRLSAAEAYEQYQEKGLFAPSGSDIYSLARASLERNDLRVTHVNPREPALPADVDVLVWLQPRRSIEPMLEEAVRFLVGGGRVILAAQHFDIQAQQFRGGDFAPRYWPRPQTPDVETLYFPQLSIELVREVLFDRLAVPVDVDAQLTGRRGGRDVERQTSALPFQIRASAAGFADVPMTRHLGDQAFVGANRLRWNDEVLGRLGLRATRLLSTSPATWSYAWKGGWIPDALLAGPSDLDGGPGTGLLGPQPLAVLFEGTFPRPDRPLRLEEWVAAAEGSREPLESPSDARAPAVADEAVPAGAEPGPAASRAERPDPREEAAHGDAGTAPEIAAAPERPWPRPAPGRLLFVGASTPFQDESLRDPTFRGDQLLWNAVATLAFAPEWIPLATRAPAERGFGYVSARTRLWGRAFVISCGPVALLTLAGVGVLVRRRRPTPRGTAVGRTQP